MTANELLDLIELGENSKVQFKEKMPHPESIAQELIAFSNSKGGKLILGVNDKDGSITGLDFQEVQEANQILVNAASQSVHPPVFVETETLRIKDKIILVTTVREGESKPYKDRNGTMYVKNGSDKRKVISNDEISRLLQSSKVLFADEATVNGSSLADIDRESFERFISRKTGAALEDLHASLPQALKNLHLLNGEQLSLAALLLFSKKRHLFRPQFSIQCAAFDSLGMPNSLYQDYESPIEGSFAEVFSKVISFLDRTMRKVPSSDSFNSASVWEIPYQVFEELIVNALVHRDYFIQASIRLFLYSDRIEIISPGKLPNSLTIENMKNGVSIARNPILQSFAQYVLPYKGLGTGVSRALALYPEIQFENAIEADQFRVIVKRKNSG